MIEFVSGDLLRAEAEALVNAVNCVGVMGRAIASQFKQSFPDNFEFYARACSDGRVVPGRMLVHSAGGSTSPRYIINFPTKRHWRGRSRLEDIDAGLTALVGVVEELRIRSIAMPALGCGLGGLDWGVVRPRIEQAFGRLADVRVQVFEPAS